MEKREESLVSRAPRSFLLLAVVALVTALAALWGTWSGAGTPDPNTATAQFASDTSSVRLAAKRLHDGRTAFALQVRVADGWGERIEPGVNLFWRVSDAVVGRWANSSLLELEGGHTVRISARARADGRLEFAIQEIVGGRPVERLLPLSRMFPTNPTVDRWYSSTPVDLAAVGSEDGLHTHRAVALLTLRQGVNRTTWLGPDDWTIAQLARGLGSALVEIRSGSLVFDPERPETGDAWPLIMTGDSLDVSVRHDVNWPQPTYAMPTIEFPGGASVEFRERVLGDVSAALEFFAESCSVHPNLAQVKMFVPKDDEACVA